MRHVAVLSCLLTVSLVGSYLTWTAPETSSSANEAVALYQAAADDLQAITWATEELTVSIERKSDAAGDYTWVTVTEIIETSFTPAATDGDEGEGDESEGDAPEGDAPEGDAPEGDDPAAEGDEPEVDDPEGPAIEGDAPETPAPQITREEKVVAFLGNNTADEIWETFAPLHALRKLDTSASKAAFGLETPSGTLTVTRRSGPISFEIGGESYGTKDQYLGFKDGVFLVDTQKLRPLRYGKTRLVQRLVSPVAKKDARTVSITTADGTTTWVQQNADDMAKAYWAAAASADTPSDEATSWMDKLFRLRVQSYTGEGEVDVGVLPEAFTATIDDGTAKWTLKVLEGEDGAYYGLSTFNRGPVELTKTLAAEAVGDVSLLFSGASEGDEPDEE